MRPLDPLPGLHPAESPSMLEDPPDIPDVTADASVFPSPIVPEQLLPLSLHGVAARSLYEFIELYFACLSTSDSGVGSAAFEQACDVLAELLVLHKLSCFLLSGQSQECLLFGSFDLPLTIHRVDSVDTEAIRSIASMTFADLCGDAGLYDRAKQICLTGVAPPSSITSEVFWQQLKGNAAAQIVEGLRLPEQVFMDGHLHEGLPRLEEVLVHQTVMKQVDVERLRVMHVCLRMLHIAEYGDTRLSAFSDRNFLTGDPCDATRYWYHMQSLFKWLQLLMSTNDCSDYFDVIQPLYSLLLYHAQQHLSDIHPQATTIIAVLSEEAQQAIFFSIDLSNIDVDATVEAFSKLLSDPIFVQCCTRLALAVFNLPEDDDVMHVLQADWRHVAASLQSPASPSPALGA